MSPRPISVVLPLILLTGLTGAVAFAGPSTSGGGTSIVCRDARGAIRHAVLLDLYETQVKFGLTAAPASGSLERDYLNAVANTYRLQGLPAMSAEIERDVRENLHRFFDIVRMTAPGEHLPLLGDTGPVPPIPAGCRLEQVAIFTDTSGAGHESVRIDGEIWGAFDSINRSALVSHETAYKSERDSHERTSESSRAFVSLVYALGGVAPVRDGEPARPLHCSALDPRAEVVTDRYPDGATSSTNTSLSGAAVFPVVMPEGPAMRFQFDVLAGRPVISKSTFDVPGIAMKTRPGYDKRAGLPVAIVTEPGKDVHVELPLRGVYRSGWSLELFYRTGLPVRWIVKNRGLPVADELVTGCSPN